VIAIVVSISLLPILFKYLQHKVKNNAGTL
jgi:hypothetical protein